MNSIQFSSTLIFVTSITSSACIYKNCVCKNCIFGGKFVCILWVNVHLNNWQSRCEKSSWLQLRASQCFWNPFALFASSLWTLQSWPIMYLEIKKRQKITVVGVGACVDLKQEWEGIVTATPFKAGSNWHILWRLKWRGTCEWPSNHVENKEMVGVCMRSFVIKLLPSILLSQFFTPTCWENMAATKAYNQSTHASILFLSQSIQGFHTTGKF